MGLPFGVRICGGDDDDGKEEKVVLGLTGEEE